MADFSLFAGLNFIILRMIRPLVIYVRPHLEFAVQAWSPWQRGEQLRLDQDLIQTYKILKGIDNLDKSTWFQQAPADKSHGG